MEAAAAVIEASKQGKQKGALRYAGLLICVIVPLLFWLSPLPIDAAEKHALAITLFMVLAWITEVIDHAIAGLIGCFLFWALGVARPDVAFSGFASDTTWFLFGATLILGSIPVDLGELELHAVDYAVPTLDYGFVVCSPELIDHVLVLLDLFDLGADSRRRGFKGVELLEVGAVARGSLSPSDI